jgi:thiol:disulfide interchange protein/DsbC/DsbD-like thiol-disulfide interchange protein
MKRVREMLIHNSVSHYLQLSLGVLLALFLFMHAVQAEPMSDEQQVSIRLIADKTNIKGGDTVTIGIEETIAPHWHVYWLNPGDSGEPTRVTWDGLEGLKADNIQWPTPHKMPVGPLTNYGYDGTVTLLQDITLPKTLPDGPFTLTANISLLVCEEICIPEIHKAEITFNDGSNGDPIAIAEARAALPVTVDWEAEYFMDGDFLRFEVFTENTATFEKLGSIELFPHEGGLIANAQEPQTRLSDSGFIIEQPVGEISAKDIPETLAVIAYEDPQGARKAITVAARHNPKQEQMMEAVAAPEGTTEESGMGFLGALFFAFVGGLILNLMPCVFPVLSLKALSLLNSHHHEEKEARAHGIAYTAGIVISFLAIAAILIGLKAGGAQIGWGFQLQNPIVVAVLSYLLFLVGLNLAGFFEVSAGMLTNAGSKLANKGGIVGSFFTGVLATAVATPCTAPFMAAALGYTLTQPEPIALIVFAMLGFGLAFPFLLLTFIPATRTMLPKPGPWMDTFKQLLAFPMFGFAAWLISVLAQQTDSLSILLVLLGMVAFSFAIWIAKKGRRVWVVIGIILGISPLFMLHTEPTPEMVMEKMASGENWGHYSEDALNEALQSPYPVFINMTAAWCITCKVNERVALSVPATKMLFKEHNVQYLKGDWTKRDEEISKFLERYGRNGVPLYVYYGPVNTATATRPAPVILPQILTPDIVRDVIENTL